MISVFTHLDRLVVRNALDPATAAFMYKQFCQSTLNFGFEFCYINKELLKLFNVRQSILVKNVLGINYFARSKPLLNELKIDPVEQLYYKHKIFGEIINNRFQCNDLNIRESIRRVLKDFNINNGYMYIKTLNELLKVNFHSNNNS